MDARPVTLRDGSAAILYCASGKWVCPICGSAELTQQPYYDDGSGSFEMCGCGFEFGFDDDPGACADADPSVMANWIRWRMRFLREIQSHPEAFARVTKRLRAIGVAI